uniref:EF-hand domain-containing protein n=1 Tax=Macrostomum lignano TaxID=282301 RepID=A0A1I8I513_9PLAT
SVEKDEFDILNTMVSECQAEQQQDTTLMRHFFGQSGKDSLDYNRFVEFMSNLQYEVLELEFLEFSKGLPSIPESEFARVLLRYTNLSPSTQAVWVDQVRDKLVREEGIGFEDFRQFFQFLNSLADFSMALQMYALAGHRVVSTVFLLLDKDGDGSLSSDELLAILKGRLKRLIHLLPQHVLLDALPVPLPRGVLAIAAVAVPAPQPGGLALAEQAEELAVGQRPVAVDVEHGEQDRQQLGRHTAASGGHHRPLEVLLADGLAGDLKHAQGEEQVAGVQQELEELLVLLSCYTFRLPRPVLQQRQAEATLGGRQAGPAKNRAPEVEWRHDGRGGGAQAGPELGQQHLALQVVGEFGELGSRDGVAGVGAEKVHKQAGAGVVVHQQLGARVSGGAVRRDDAVQPAELVGVQGAVAIAIKGAEGDLEAGAGLGEHIEQQQELRVGDEAVAAEVAEQVVAGAALAGRGAQHRPVFGLGQHVTSTANSATSLGFGRRFIVAAGVESDGLKEVERAEVGGAIVLQRGELQKAALAPVQAAPAAGPGCRGLRGRQLRFGHGNGGGSSGSLFELSEGQRGSCGGGGSCGQEETLPSASRSRRSRASIKSSTTEAEHPALLLMAQTMGRRRCRRGSSEAAGAGKAASANKLCRQPKSHVRCLLSCRLMADRARRESMRRAGGQLELITTQQGRSAKTPINIEEGMKKSVEKRRRRKRTGPGGYASLSTREVKKRRGQKQEETVQCSAVQCTEEAKRRKRKRSRVSISKASESPKKHHGGPEPAGGHGRNWRRRWAAAPTKEAAEPRWASAPGDAGTALDAAQRALTARRGQGGKRSDSRPARRTRRPRQTMGRRQSARSSSCCQRRPLVTTGLRLERHQAEQRLRGRVARSGGSQHRRQQQQQRRQQGQTLPKLRRLAAAQKAVRRNPQLQRRHHGLGISTSRACRWPRRWRQSAPTWSPGRVPAAASTSAPTSDADGPAGDVKADDEDEAAIGGGGGGRAGESNMSDTIFWQTQDAKTFKAEKLDKYQQRLEQERKEREQYLEGVVEEDTSNRTLKCAIGFTKVYNYLGTVLLGLMPGFALLHTVYVWTLSSNYLSFLADYSRLGSPMPILYYVVLTLILLSVLDRYDTGKLDRGSCLECASFRHGGMVVLLYIPAYVVSNAMYPTDQWMRGYSLNATAYAGIANGDSLVQSWRIMDTVRAACLALGWLVVAFNPQFNRLADNLETSWTTSSPHSPALAGPAAAAAEDEAAAVSLFGDSSGDSSGSAGRSGRSRGIGSSGGSGGGGGSGTQHHAAPVMAAASRAAVAVAAADRGGEVLLRIWERAPDKMRLRDGSQQKKRLELLSCLLEEAKKFNAE